MILDFQMPAVKKNKNFRESSFLCYYLQKEFRRAHNDSIYCNERPPNENSAPLSTKIRASCLLTFISQ
ncbi:hypothetical protein HMPREF7215_0041 [Pyramidobacter piscolens W5455]|uniref:Uncharacterized protein n=1 Tax=Pyramidobacter piscolens W5455 TaxID=352165 RepID=A0ABM9ZUM4_9BACT|nr:hypothetical protein HMPREF7215_0041 [Pyramidobacter piscolens W5455]